MHCLSLSCPEAELKLNMREFLLCCQRSRSEGKGTEAETEKGPAWHSLLSWPLLGGKRDAGLTRRPLQGQRMTMKQDSPSVGRKREARPPASIPCRPSFAPQGVRSSPLSGARVWVPSAREGPVVSHASESTADLRTRGEVEYEVSTQSCTELPG